jgi:hypothetical protein
MSDSRCADGPAAPASAATWFRVGTCLDVEERSAVRFDIDVRRRDSTSFSLGRQGVTVSGTITPEEALRVGEAILRAQRRVG